MKDLRLKSAIKSRIEYLLYHEPQTKLHNEFLEIIQLNGQLDNSQTPVFSYRGKRYSNGYVPRWMSTRLLHETLHGRMDTYLADLEVIHAEIPLAMGYVQNVLNQSDDPCVYIQLLPTALHPAIRELTDYLKIPKSHTLSLSDAEKLINTHGQSIGIIKQRLMFNLLYKG